MKKLALGLFAFLSSGFVHAETLNLQQVIDKALQADPRISEMEAYVAKARAQQEEVFAKGDIRLTLNSTLGLSPGFKGGVFTQDPCGSSVDCKLRTDRYNYKKNGLSPWWYMQFALIKPLSSFGKIKNYAIAAKNNIKVKEQDVRLQRGKTEYDVKRAYFGFLTAHDSRLFLEDVTKRIKDALETVQKNLDENNGQSTRSDLYALQSALGLAQSYLKKAAALEQIASGGLKVLIGMPLDSQLQLADTSLQPVDLPKLELEKLTAKAMADRPEMDQLKHGLVAQDALMRAKKAMQRPNLFTGVMGTVSYSPLREQKYNPLIYDPFNYFGATPVIGIQWEWEGGVPNAQAKQEKAELSALMDKNSLAERGIPYEVSEAASQVKAHYDALQDLKFSAKSARRWMISLYTEFQAGLKPVDKLVNAFQAYVLTYTDYLQTVYDYNMQVANLEKVIGDYK